MGYDSPRTDDYEYSLIFSGLNFSENRIEYISIEKGQVESREALLY